MNGADLLLWAAGWVGGLAASAFVLWILLVTGALNRIMFGKRR